MTPRSFPRRQLLATAAAAALTVGCGQNVDTARGPAPVTPTTASVAGAELPWWQRPPGSDPIPAGPITLSGDVLFNPDSAELTSSASSQLQPVAAIMAANPLANAVVDGHTDGGDGGPPDTAYRLSQARAEAVRTWLADHGIDPTRITVRGWGPSRPLHPSDTPEHRAQNRRCEIIILNSPK